MEDDKIKKLETDRLILRQIQEEYIISFVLMQC